MTDTTQLPAQAKAGGAIDCHSHAWSDDLAAYPLTGGITAAQMKPARFHAQDLLARCESLDIARVVLVQQVQFHKYDNSYITDMARQYPGRFGLIGSVGEAEPNAAEMMQELHGQNVRGFRIRANNSAAWVDSSVMNQMWKTAAALGQAMCPLFNPRMQDNSEDGLLHVDQLCRKHPETKVVIDHMGDCHPGAPEKLQHLQALARYPNVYVKISGLNENGIIPFEDYRPQILRIIEAFGLKKLMWGSNMPVLENNQAGVLEAAVRFTRTGLGLSAEDLKQLMEDTAHSVFFSAKP